jgi:hypothetical protein
MMASRKMTPISTVRKTSVRAECSQPDGSGVEKRRRYARLLLAPETAAVLAIRAAEGVEDLQKCTDLKMLVDVLRSQAEAVSNNDMTQIEAMLVNQATALQYLFSNLTSRAMSQPVISSLEAFMRMALRAQSQCRATLETLAAIKNPPVVYARQANVTTGPQQIINGTAASSQAGEMEIQQSKLLEVQHGNYLDTSAAGAAIGVDSELATVGEIDRAKVRRG